MTSDFLAYVDDVQPNLRCFVFRTLAFFDERMIVCLAEIEDETRSDDTRCEYSERESNLPRQVLERVSARAQCRTVVNDTYWWMDPSKNIGNTDDHITSECVNEKLDKTVNANTHIKGNVMLSRKRMYPKELRKE